MNAPARNLLSRLSMKPESRYEAMRSKKTAWAMLLLPFVLNGPSAARADPAPEIHQPFVDDFGLDRKSGRVMTPTPRQINVGGDGPQNISMAYIPMSPGRPGSQDYASMSQLSMRLVGHVFIARSTGRNGTDFFEYYTIQYPEGSATFRRDITTGGAFGAEYPDGGTLTATANGILFTDRNGITLETNANSDNSTILSYPDGRQVFYDKTAGDGATTYSISNNFGFILKNQTAADGMRTLAANQSVDICTLASASCTGLTKDRHSLIANSGSSNNWTFYDAAGARTIYRSIAIEAMTEKLYCYSTDTGMGGGYQTCNNPFPVTRHYPAGITFPKDSTESVTISYSNPDSQDEVGVSSIVKNGTTITYYQQRTLYGSYGSSPDPNTLPYLLKITSSIGGSQIAYSQADRGFIGWGGGRMVLDSVTDALSHATTFSFNLLHEVSAVHLPEGNGQRFEYDSRWNVSYAYEIPKTGSGASELVAHYIYPASCSASSQAYCNKPTAIIDRRNNQTDFSYNTRGQILTETGPADTSGSRPITTYEYTLRTAYIKSSSGSVIAAGSPISLLTKQTVCRLQQSCVGTADAVTTTYDYGPATGLNNLLLRGVVVTADGKTRRTCYQYDYFGKKMSETRPMAGLATCS